MPGLKTGDSTASQSRKRSIFSNMGRDLTPSEIEFLKADAKRGNDELDRLLAADLKRRIPKAA